jgi:lipoyl-dependent peroxiredoxin
MRARNGSTDWGGDVKNGSGTITVGDGVFRGPYSYDSRFGDHQGTNPEQLIAAAQAGCFTMALASKLTSGGFPRDLLRMNATVHLRMLDGSISLARLEIETKGTVKGIDEE